MLLLVATGRRQIRRGLQRNGERKRDEKNTDANYKRIAKSFDLCEA